MYDSQFSRRTDFASAEATAHQNNVSLWGYEAATPTLTPTPTPEPEATPIPDGGSTGELAVVGIHADASGNDHDNLNEAYTTFENTGDAMLDLSGWSVADEADHTYYFQSVTLEPGETVTLYTGSGSDSGGDLYWGSESAVWNNGGDTIIVTTDDGTMVIEHTYFS